MIEEFTRRHGLGARPIDETVSRWAAERELQDLLGTPIMAGVLLGDLLLGDGLSDDIPPRVATAFRNVMGDSADSAVEIRRLLQETADEGAEPLRGLISKIQGQLGENAFIDASHGARLASSGNQEGWDVAIDGSDGTRWVQVKVHESPYAAVDALVEANAKAAAGQLTDGAMIVDRVDIAVNSDIADGVRSRLAEQGLDVEVFDLGLTRDGARGLLEASADRVVYFNPGDFLGDILGTSVAATVVHTALNGLLWHRKAKSFEAAVADTAYSSAASAGGIGVAHGVAVLLAKTELAASSLGGPVSALAVLGAGMTARSLLRRIADRRFVVGRLQTGNERLEAHIALLTGGTACPRPA